MNRTVLSVLNCTAQYCTVLRCTVLHCTELYYTSLYCNAVYCVVLECARQNCSVLALQAVLCSPKAWEACCRLVTIAALPWSRSFLVGVPTLAGV